MSKIIFACIKDGSEQELTRLKKSILAAAQRIAPESDGYRPASVSSAERTITAVLNPSTTVLSESGSVCVGHISGNCKWSKVGSARPEGTYAIVRVAPDAIEVLTDAVASRTVWYYFDKERFLASTSQRLIVTVLGSFELNTKALPWMLSTGTLGPTAGWDARLQRLQADSLLEVDRLRWTTTVRQRESEFKVSEGSLAKHKEDLRSRLEDALGSLDLNYSKWVLPLSGGYDSRAILQFLSCQKGLRAITWGTNEALGNPSSDAAIAARLALELDVPHEYFETDHVAGSIEQVFADFIRHSEGRVDRIGGYLDGFYVWRSLMNRGIEGIIRGDEGFGWRKVRSFVEARQSVGLWFWSDFDRLPLLESIGLESQSLPGFLDRRVEESPSQWRDRLYHQYRIPTMLAALTDPKASYVEIANPLLTHSVIQHVRTMPDELRTEKSLFKKIVEEQFPRLPFASMKAIADQRAVLRSNEATEILGRCLRSDIARGIFSRELLNFVEQGMARDSISNMAPVPISIRKRVRNWVPATLRNAVRLPTQRPSIDFFAIAFRLYLACGSSELLQADSRAAMRSR